MNQKSVEVAMIMADQEEAIGRLYLVYRQKCPNYEKFWAGLADEEASHAEWIRGLIQKVRQGTVYFNDSRFNVEAVKSSLEYIRQEIKNTEINGITELGALAIAFALEDALLEKKFFEIFEGDSVELKHVLQDLEESTRNHRGLVKKNLDAARLAQS